MPTRHDVSQVPLQGGYVAKQCPVRAQNDALLPGIPLEPDPFVQRRFDRGNAFEAEIVAALMAVESATVVIHGGGETAEAATVAAMRAGAPLIFNGRLRDEAGRRIGKPDLLVLSACGGYRSVDVKWHSTLSAAGPKHEPALTSPLTELRFEIAQPVADWRLSRHEEDALQLAHYQRILEVLGLAAKDRRWGGIIGTERTVVWHDLDLAQWRTPSVSEKTKLRTTMERYDFEFDFRLDIIAVAQQHAADPAVTTLVVPVRCGECPECPWRDVCMPVLEVPPGDVSLLPRIGWTQWKFHHDRGITNRAELAAIDIETDADRFAGMSLTTLQEQIDQARAAVGEDPAYRRRGIAAIVVPSADIEVDVDMENVETGCYLWGTHLTRNPAAQRPFDAIDGYRAFVSWEPMTPGVEAANSLEFWRYLMSLRARAHAAGLSFRAYCWNENAENTYLRRLGQLAGIEADVEAFIASDEWVDLLKVWDSQLITGHGSGLKLIAPLTGFHWSVDDPGGGESMLKYDLAATGDAAAREWLTSYNQGDVEATLSVREWLCRAELDSIG